MGKKDETDKDELKSMIEKLIDEVSGLKDRIKKLERFDRYNRNPFEHDTPPLRRKSRTCPHCKGEGKIEDWTPYKYPFYGVD
mgnify:CR=1 FL=1